MSESTILGDSIDVARSASRAEPDACGQAALLLAESILHGLIEARVIDARQAAAIVRRAAEVKIEFAAAINESTGRMEQSLALLERIEASVAADERAGWTPLR